MKSWIVYRHSSPSGKVYIGMTADIKDRWASNGRNYCTYNSIFKKAIEKYGWDNIHHEILLEGITKSEAIYAEKYLIKWYKLHNMSYNITDGGEGTYGRKDSLDTIEKRRASLVGQKRTSEQKERMRQSHLTEQALLSSRKTIEYAHAAWKGSHHSVETKKRMSESAKGRDMSEAKDALQKIRREKAVPIVITKDGMFIGEYQLMADACRNLNINQSNTLRALKRGIKVKGYSVNLKS